MINLKDGSSRLRFPVLLFIGFMLILFSRRHAQWSSPQVWSEDGVLVLAGFFKHGWLSLLEPVNGYLATGLTPGRCSCLERHVNRRCGRIC
jgi:hypothetical protein